MRKYESGKEFEKGNLSISAAGNIGRVLNHVDES